MNEAITFFDRIQIFYGRISNFRGYDSAILINRYIWLFELSEVANLKKEEFVLYEKNLLAK